MKTLILKKLSKFSYKANILSILQNAPTQGYTVDEVRLAVKALDVLEKATDKAIFEDNIYEFIKISINKAKFTIASKELLQFINDINAI